MKSCKQLNQYKLVKPNNDNPKARPGAAAISSKLHLAFGDRSFVQSTFAHTKKRCISLAVVQWYLPGVVTNILVKMLPNDKAQFVLYISMKLPIEDSQICP